MKNDSQIIIYQTKDGKTKLQVKFEGETAWLTQEQMAELFDKGRSTITEHINNIFEEGELQENSDGSVTAQNIQLNPQARGIFNQHPQGQ